MPVVISSKPRDSTRRSTFDAPAPRAIRSPSSRVLCETVYDSVNRDLLEDKALICEESRVTVQRCPSSLEFTKTTSAEAEDNSGAEPEIILPVCEPVGNLC